MDNQNPDSEIDSSHAADQTRKTDDQSLIAVGVGASAGGLEAFNELLRHLPANTGMAFVLIQHLDPRAFRHAWPRHNRAERYRDDAQAK